MKIYEELSIFYLSMLNDDKSSLEFILSGIVPVKTFTYLYRLFVKENGLTPIENLQENKKIELVNECRKTELNFTNSSLINAAKILHTLNFINENS